ncbi:type III-B CRISPR module-associated protein Cmr3 [Rhodoferax antarcticus]|uniref:CRISPR-associated family protein n=1 Tax=Rhodoferax antarcticus ANT.BR TaxID=1111071 RepID=A0A1Q8YEQ2_9BURK|nr:type III-B CRISPR module-associated protein Cmr3 [Rhodoferax antarcticus]APW46301.1 type III-B CRISPR module-associated protein Cmr3 [Rhodoferax antarcticus]OLP06513.1 CRISPR-associated family protein [Rhodoferax antarcticus ANT.BR]
MSTTTYFYVRPTDSLFVRGNLAFGDSGEHGTSLMPPPPSLFAGAFRSALLGKDAAQLASFVAAGRCTNPQLAQCLGTPTAPGDFCITWLSLAGNTGTEADPKPEPLSPLPADLLMLGKTFTKLEPRPLTKGVQSAGDLPQRATLISGKQEKPTGGIYLRGKGLNLHLQGQMPEQAHGVPSSHLYQRDPRLGIGLNLDARTAEEGQIYTTEGYAFSPSTGFLVGIQGAANLLPTKGVLRLGGDGRSANYQQIQFTPPKRPDSITAKKRFRLILQTPAIFSQGWLPEGIVQQNNSGLRLSGKGYSAILSCASLGRRDVISGWDLHQWAPKPAQAAVPAGSVYWFEQFEGDIDKLAAWVDGGLWPDTLDANQAMRRAEGYNRALLGAWN